MYRPLCPFRVTIEAAVRHSVRYEEPRNQGSMSFSSSLPFRLPSACRSCLLGSKSRVHPELKWSCAFTSSSHSWRGAWHSTAQYLPWNDCNKHKRCSQRICNASGCAVNHHSVNSCDLRGPRTCSVINWVFQSSTKDNTKNRRERMIQRSNMFMDCGRDGVVGIATR